MEFKDKPSNYDQPGQFEIVLQTQDEHDVVVAAITDLAISIMVGEAASVDRATEDRLVEYLALNETAQSHLTVTPTQAIRFARLIQYGAVSLPEDKQKRALSLAESIELEALAREIQE